MRLNPVFKKELKMMARSKQLPVLAVVFNGMLTVVGMIVLYCIGMMYSRNGQSPYKDMMIFYGAMLTIEAGMLCLFVPSAAGGSIAGEREWQTLDILLATKMTVPGILVGKLLSCISMAVLLCVSAMPILTISALYGGIGLMEVYQSLLYVGFLVLFIGCIGVFCSCRFKKTTFASMAAYGIIIFLTVGTGLLVLLLNLAAAINNGNMVYFSAGGGGSSIVQWAIYIWLLNPAVTYIAILYGQLADMRTVTEFMEAYGVAPEIVNHWVGLSIVAQALMIALLIFFAAKYLDPQNERFTVGRKILKKNKRR